MKWITVLLMWAGLSAQAREFTEDENKMFIASQVLTVADWMQTRDIARRTDDFHETNPLLGRYPSMGTVNTYFVASLVGNYYFTNYLDEHRMVWLKIHNISRGATVINNASIGLKMSF